MACKILRKGAGFRQCCGKGGLFRGLSSPRQSGGMQELRCLHTLCSTHRNPETSGNKTGRHVKHFQDNMTWDSKLSCSLEVCVSYKVIHNSILITLAVVSMVNNSLVGQPLGTPSL